MRNNLSAAMAAASPTPFAASYGDPARRPMSRQNVSKVSSRPNLRRGEPLAQSVYNGASVPQSWKFSVGDSSDDELPVPPMKFSAAAKALLGDEASVTEGSSPSQKEHGQRDGSRQEIHRPVQRRSQAVPQGTTTRERTASPLSSRSGSPRIVRLNANPTGLSSLRRSQSVFEGQSSPEVQRQRDLVTPGPRVRSLQNISPQTRSESLSVRDKEPRTAKHSSAGSGVQPELSTNSREHSSIHEAAAHMENLSINRSKGDEMGMHTSQRQKRGLKVTGRFLSGPARRGIKRRQSEEDPSPAHEGGLSSGGANEAAPEYPGHSEQDSAHGVFESHVEATEGHPVNRDHQRPPHVRFQSQANIITGSPNQKDPAPLKAALMNTIENKPKVHSPSSATRSLGNGAQPPFKVPSLPPLPSRFDQENEPPPTFKRNKTNGVGLSEKPGKMGIAADEIMLVATPATNTPHRPALASRSQNTPHRPAPPPPPKMTVLETATATAGAASASQARKKRNQYMSVNGKFFTRMNCIGRGGSSKVYRVMAENYKVFALKRVTLEDQDEHAIRGYKGEIDLLCKLEKVDRVVNLLDFEINEEKQTLSVLMEMGESDLSSILDRRLKAEDASFDITFTRYFWKEMLECVQAVHAYDIVHSDLKPANFLLLQGRLKLIDFGISNAIADNTVNVHREQQVGTPNFMSPEALIDFNAAAGLPSTEGKMMKIGKPSDVWSLGCILYQMTYGKPPFAHIANQVQRVMAIVNPRHVISFPATGLGGALVPPGLVRTLRRCLNRDPTQRPTVDELLAYGDPFLFPDIMAKDTVPIGQELIARMQHNIIKHVRDKGLPSEAELKTWPERFYASIKAAVEEGRA